MLDDELDGRVARLARIGRAARDFSTARFRRDLESAVHEGPSRTDVLCRLIADWTGVAFTEGRATTRSNTEAGACAYRTPHFVDQGPQPGRSRRARRGRAVS